MRARNYFLIAVVALNLLVVSQLFYRTIVQLPPVEDEHPAATGQLREPYDYRSDYCDCQRTIEAVPYDDVIHWCGEETSLRGFNQNVIGYSLYGDSVQKNQSTRYYLLLDVLPRQVRLHYPDWRMRIYHNIRKWQVREHEMLCKMYCQNDNVDLCDINDMVLTLSKVHSDFKMSTPFKGIDIMKLHKKMWRYLPMIDPQVDRYMSRDMDSEINERELAAVSEWLPSQFTFHSMRDHQGHGAAIMGGLFGAKVHQRRDLIQGLTRSMINLGTKYQESGLDQTMISIVFWPTAKDDAVIHDSYFCQRDWNSLPSRPFPTQRINGTFVSDRTGADWDRPRRCPPKCRPVDHQDWHFC